MGTVREHVEHGVELYNRHDFGEITTSYAPDAVEITPQGTYTGYEAIAGRYREHWGTFPDGHIEPFSWTVEGDTAVVEYTWTGTHTGPMTGPDGTQIPPTGKHVAFPVVSAFQVRDGRTVSHRVYWDQLSALAQLGVMESPT